MKFPHSIASKCLKCLHGSSALTLGAISLGCISIEWFPIEYRKIKTKVITLANHKGRRQYSEPIKTWSNYRWLMQSAGKSIERVTIGFLVVFLIGWKSGANLLSQSRSIESAKPITYRHSSKSRSNGSKITITCLLSLKSKERFSIECQK